MKLLKLEPRELLVGIPLFFCGFFSALITLDVGFIKDESDIGSFLSGIGTIGLVLIGIWGIDSWKNKFKHEKRYAMLVEIERSMKLFSINFLEYTSLSKQVFLNPKIKTIDGKVFYIVKLRDLEEEKTIENKEKDTYFTMSKNNLMEAFGKIRDIKIFIADSEYKDLEKKFYEQYHEAFAIKYAIDNWHTHNNWPSSQKIIVSQGMFNNLLKTMMEK